MSLLEAPLYRRLTDDSWVRFDPFTNTFSVLLADHTPRLTEADPVPLRLAIPSAKGDCGSWGSRFPAMLPLRPWEQILFHVFG